MVDFWKVDGRLRPHQEVLVEVEGMMRKLGLALLILGGCGGGEEGGPAESEDIDCGSASDQIFTVDADLTLPTEKEGELDDILVGLWQFTANFRNEIASERSSETRDLRYAFPTPRSVIYCQDVDFPDVDGHQASEFTRTGDTLEFGNGFTAVAWSTDHMLWRNDFFEDVDEFFLLERIR